MKNNNLHYKNFLYCYDLKLSNHLKNNEISYIIKARSIKDGNIFTMYEKTDELMNIVNKWNVDNH